FVTDQGTGAAPEAGQGRSATRRSDRVKETAIGETLKITFLFERRYLGNGRSYRDEMKSVLKGKELRFLRCIFEFFMTRNTVCTGDQSVFLIRVYGIDSSLMSTLIVPLLENGYVTLQLCLAILVQRHALTREDLPWRSFRFTSVVSSLFETL
ncbi:hypothetical protein K0M31_000469, partial [Melipona bicolor]